MQLKTCTLVIHKSEVFMEAFQIQQRGSKFRIKVIEKRAVSSPCIVDAFCEYPRIAFMKGKEREVIIPPGGPPLYAAGWGWNSGGRAGNVTEEELRVPRQLQRSLLADESFISCAAGQHHTLLATDLGRVYALGEGRRGQLGFGNQFTGALKKGGVYQAFPRLTTPSGAYTYKTDLKIGQVACGGSFSIAREISTEEGVDTSIGFRELEQAFLSLRTTYYESNSILQAWSTIRQERFKISRQAEGQLLVWGTGEHGELGLGVLGKLSLYPQPVWKLRDVCITHVAAGNRHVLAVDDRGRLFSWGCGTDGRLGHGDFRDRDRPELVMFFASLYVESCAAGDAHSAVLTTMRAGSRNTQLKRISTFGRGAHGRLGNGTNRNMCSPVLVSKWLPSLQKVQFHQLACGGAHTLALASQIVPQGIANPRGLETFVVAWGYGKNGQLGTGYRYDSFVPVKARMPRWDIITEISAGRSWSMAKSAGGEVYTWGKGLRGQLGQGPEKFCLAPRKIESFASFVHISSGYAHNVAITTPKRFLSTELTERKAKHDRADYKPLEPYVKATLKRSNSTSLFAFDCCRRNAAPWKKKTRFRCLDCMCASICLLCVKLCHRGHRVILLDAAEVAVLDDPEAAEPEVHTSDYMPYRCAVLFLAHLSVLRPKRGSLECMPRSSILDLSSHLKKETPPPPGQKPEVRRRNRENTKENEVNPRYLEVDRSLHHFVKTVVPKKEAKKPGMDRKFRRMTKVKAVAKKETGPEIVETIVAAPVVLKVPCCRCGVFNQQCRVIPVIPEHPDEDILHLEEVEASKKAEESAKLNGGRDSPTVKDTDSPQTIDRKRLIQRQQQEERDVAYQKQQLLLQEVYSKKAKRKKAAKDKHYDPTFLRNHLLRRDEGVRTIAARRIQRLGQFYMRRVREHKERLEYIILRREVCAEHFQKKVLDVVFATVWKEYGNYREIQELASMAHEEALTRKYTYYIGLQQSIIGIEAMTYGLRKLCGMMTPSLPRITLDGVVTDQWRPVFAHTVNSIRAQQLLLPSIRRASASVIALQTRNIPRLAEGKFREGYFTDSDLMLLCDRYLRDKASEKWRHAVAAAAARKEAMRQKIAAMALERLKAKQNATKAAMQQAEALTLKNNMKAVGGPPPPPAGPPPRFMVIRAAMEAKQERAWKARLAVRDAERLEDAEFSITHKMPETKWKQRRHTIADPSELYGRVTTMRAKIVQSNAIKRRNSLPGKIHLMHMPSQPTPYWRIDQVQQSLEMFTQRLNMVKKVQKGIIKSRVDGSYLEANKRKPVDTYVHWASRLFQKCVLNPRLPCEMNGILVDGYRRRTIGEPERLARQLNVMMDTREVYCEFVESTQTDLSYLRRRRSFDHGEFLDANLGVAEALGFEFEEVKKVSATVTGLKKDAIHMETLMIKAQFMAENERKTPLAKEDAPLTMSMSNRFAKPAVGNAAKKVGATTGGGGRKDKAKGGLSAVRLGADKHAEPEPAAYDFSEFSDAPQAYGQSHDASAAAGGAGYDVHGYALQPYAEGDEYAEGAYDNAYGGYGSEGYTSEYDGTQSLTQVGHWDDAGTVTTWEGEGYSQYGALAHVWQEHYTESGKAYFYNVTTGASSWEMPTHVDTQIETQNQDENGSWYWFNNVTGESKWM